MYTVTGNTYKAKESLKAIGFSWDAEKRGWFAEEVDFEAWKNKHLNPTYIGRKQARLNEEAGIQFSKVETEEPKKEAEAQEGIIEFANAEKTMFVRLERGEIYGNPDIFVAFWKKSESEKWNKQGQFSYDKWAAQVELLESQGLIKI